VRSAPPPSDATFRASDSVNLIRHLYKSILPALGMAFLLGACAAAMECLARAIEEYSLEEHEEHEEKNFTAENAKDAKTFAAS
jgi:hypothetical protein